MRRILLHLKKYQMLVFLFYSSVHYPDFLLFLFNLLPLPGYLACHETCGRWCTRHRRQRWWDHTSED
jgi:hypothetical protein